MSNPSPIDWQRLRRAKEAGIEGLKGLRLSEVTPSRRDLSSFLGRGRGDVAAIAVLRRRDPWSGATWGDLDVEHAAAALDDAEVAAIGVSTEPISFGGRDEDVTAAAAAATAPILRDDFLLHPLEVFQSRMLGADSCVAVISWMAPATLTELTRTASSLHMTAILAAFTPEDVERVQAVERHALGFWALDERGELDHERLRRLSAAAPKQRSVVLLGDLPASTPLEELRGLVDGVLVARALQGADDPAAAVRRITGDAA